MELRTMTLVINIDQSKEIPTWIWDSLKDGSYVHGLQVVGISEGKGFPADKEPAENEECPECGVTTGITVDASGDDPVFECECGQMWKGEY